ncbi:unnamed protein product [Vitrella brassicaformis CCMP3155]|uniref:Uncharacterized protein n=2 Tax=Vitrella brassicaformis TaxID=1169539 RepID=A0A0G4ELB6_VITBC|nr:unnamed protein product [Vitrella brassicaformis CCMP3155]|eukprot:CEL97971.1 unnamed protein product [Vitrella brassicaformis CCMP3155]
MCVWTTFSGTQGCIFGVLLYSVGASRKIQADALNPNDDFEALGRVCTIIDIEVNMTISGGRDNNDVTCEDKYTYSFMAGILGPYTSITETKSQPGRDGSCPVQTLHLETFEKGQVVDCWRIRDGKGDVAWWYRCGNKPHCYKIFNPEQDVKAQKSDGTSAMAAGAAAFGVGLVVMGICLLRFCCCDFRQPRPMSAVLLPRYQYAYQHPAQAPAQGVQMSVQQPGGVAVGVPQPGVPPGGVQPSVPPGGVAPGFITRV